MTAVHPLRAYRERVEISAPELARRLGVRANTVWRWESGRQRIAPSVVVRVHEETGIPLGELTAFGLLEREEAKQ